MHRLLSGLAVASLMMLGASTAAYAYDPTMPPTCDNGSNPAPAGFSGDLTIAVDSCTSASISASGNVSVSTSGGSISIGTLSAGGQAVVQANGGSVSVGASSSGGSMAIGSNSSDGSSYGPITISGTLTAPSIGILGSSASVTGDLDGNGQVGVTAQTGSINIDGTINAQGGNVSLVAYNSDVTAAATNGQNVTITAGSALGVGNVSVSDAIAATTALQIQAGGNVGTEDITSPYVQINVNYFGVSGTNTFLIGGGGSNGTGSIDATPSSGSYGEIYITNGATSSGVGNITVSSASDISIPDGGGTAGGGYLALEAYGGTLTLPTGSISVPGGQAAIELAATEVDTVDGTTISADYTAGGQYHYVDIYADTFKYSGTVVISSNGSGLDSASGDQGSVYMQGYTTSGPTTQVQVIGTSGATLSMGADGDYTFAQVYGDNITFSGGAVTMHAKGTTDHQIFITNVNTGAGNADTLTISGDAFTADASGDGGAGGAIDIEAGAANVSSSDFTLNADASGGGDGAGGSVTLNAGALTYASATTADVTATGEGAGNGGDISITATSDIKGTDNFNLAAGGGCNSGDGGTIALNGNNVTFGAIDASGGEASGGGTCLAIAAQSSNSLQPRTTGTGKGGNITVTAAAAIIPPASINSSLVADGLLGDGGEVTITTIGSATFTVGSGPNKTTISASSQDTGNGGIITVNSAGQFVVDGNALSAKAGPNGNGTGGTISGTTVDGDMVISGGINVDGKGTGQGGQLSLITQGGSSNLDVTTNAATLSANGGASGGAGGTIQLFPAKQMDLSALHSMTFTAQGMGSGGGGLVWISQVSNMDLLQVIDVDAGSDAAWNLNTGNGLGVIRLNNYYCREWKIDGAAHTWPARYWVASSTPPTTSPLPLDNVPVNTADNAMFDNLRGRFNTGKVELFVFKSSADFGGFTGLVNLNAATGGLTWDNPSTGNYIYLSPWESGSIGDPVTTVSYDSTTYPEVVAHEMGHAYSLTNGGLVTAPGTPWQTAKSSDVNTLNAASACSGAIPAFRNVTDITHKDSSGNPAPQSVCDGTSLRSDYTAYTSNFALAQGLDPAFVVDEELHAQMFAYAATGATGARPMVDQIIANGYFTGLLAIANTEK